jgi:hypothetical protein
MFLNAVGDDVMALVLARDPSALIAHLTELQRGDGGTCVYMNMQHIPVSYLDDALEAFRKHKTPYMRDVCRDALRAANAARGTLPTSQPADSVCIIEIGEGQYLQRGKAHAEDSPARDAKRDGHASAVAVKFATSSTHVALARVPALASGLKDEKLAATYEGLAFHLLHTLYPSTVLGKVGASVSQHFNNLAKRIAPLYQAMMKAEGITRDEALARLAPYERYAIDVRIAAGGSLTSAMEELVRVEKLLTVKIATGGSGGGGGSGSGSGDATLLHRLKAANVATITPEDARALCVAGANAPPATARQFLTLARAVLAELGQRNAAGCAAGGGCCCLLRDLLRFDGTVACYRLEIFWMPSVMT